MLLTLDNYPYKVTRINQAKKVKFTLSFSVFNRDCYAKRKVRSGFYFK